MSNAAPPRFQFGLAAMLLTMLLVGIAAAGFAGLLRNLDDGEVLAATIVLMLVAPVGTLVVLSLVQSVRAWLKKRRK